VSYLIRSYFTDCYFLFVAVRGGIGDGKLNHPTPVMPGLTRPSSFKEFSFFY